MTADSTGPAGAKAPSSTGLPPGVVLDKDGKPCRTCSSGSAFKTFASQARTGLKAGALPSAAAAAAATAAPTASAPSDCPPDVEALGRSTWTLLHSIAATYPSKPSVSQQSDLRSFMSVFSRLYPCWVCADDFQSYMEKERIEVGSRDEFGTWLCEAHNAVNVKLGKERFDCKRWQERWRTGWKDGRCD
ncbi:augmenter of liver regeneration [Xylariales sp. AK1849]|nr:augmenter of liver regeneration [Xylariales sp. AK1849]